MNSNDVSKESDISKIVKEDILRILGEKKVKVSLESIEFEIKVSHSLLSKTIKSLEEENLVKVEKGLIRLTKKGREESKVIVNKHQVLENYFKEKRSEREAHRAAHLIEHYISEEVLNNIKKINTLNKEGIPLVKFGLKIV